MIKAAALLCFLAVLPFAYSQSPSPLPIFAPPPPEPLEPTTCPPPMEKLRTHRWQTALGPLRNSNFFDGCINQKIINVPLIKSVPNTTNLHYCTKECSLDRSCQGVNRYADTGLCKLYGVGAEDEINWQNNTMGVESARIDK